MSTNTTNSQPTPTTSKTGQLAESCAVCTMNLSTHNQRDLAFCIKFSFFGEEAEDKFRCVRCDKRGNLPTLFRHAKTLYRQIKTQAQSMPPQGVNLGAVDGLNMPEWRRSQLAFMARREETSNTYPKQVQIVQETVRHSHTPSSATKSFSCQICKKFGKKASTRRLARMVDHIKLHFRSRALVCVKTGADGRQRRYRLGKQQREPRRRSRQ